MRPPSGGGPTILLFHLRSVGSSFRGSGSSICIVPLLFCLRVRFSRVEQLSLERRRLGGGEEEEQAEVALGLDSPYKVRSSLWILCASFFGLPKCGLIVGFVF